MAWGEAKRLKKHGVKSKINNETPGLKGRLNPEIKDIIKGTIDGPDLDRIWLDTRGIPGWVSQFSAAEKPVAMTIGYRIWFEPGAYNWRNLFHELKHVEHFYKHKDGFIDEYSEAVWIHGYKKNRFERQARNYADKMMERIEND